MKKTSKADEIRKEQKKGGGPKAIAERLKARGIMVSAAYVSTLGSADKKKKTKKKKGKGDSAKTGKAKKKKRGGRKSSSSSPVATIQPTLDGNTASFNDLTEDAILTAKQLLDQAGDSDLAVRILNLVIAVQPVVSP